MNKYVSKITAFEGAFYGILTESREFWMMGTHTYIQRYTHTHSGLQACAHKQ